MPISRIDPSKNQLFFRGMNATELSSSSNFEESLHLLVNGILPSHEDLRTISQRMIELRNLYHEDIDSLFDLAGRMDRIRNENDLTIFDTLLAFVSIAPLVVAYDLGLNQEWEIQSPDKKLGHAANFLWMTRGGIPKEEDLRDFQSSLILHMDDPDNPSLSALETNVKEGKSISDTLLAALTVHVGTLHHGAGAEAMKMFEEIKEKADVRRYLEQRLESGGKIYGLGHRIYSGVDPRAIVLRKMLERRVTNTKHHWLLHVADSIAKEGRLLLAEYKEIDAFPNVDLYNAAVYFALGFPPELNTSLFAVSRSTGWMAHVLECYKHQQVKK